MLFYLAMISDPQERADFEQVYNDYHLACLNEALRYTNHNQYLAEDAVHNAVVKIMDNYPEYLKDSCSKLKSSFVLIVRNEAIDLMRKEKIRNHESLYDNEETADSNELSLHELFEGHETYEEILAAINELDDLYKVVLIHRYLYDMTYKEIAALLSLTEKNVSVRLYRAKLQLREALSRGGVSCV